MRRFFFRGRDLLRSIASLPALIFLAFVVVAFAQLATTDESWRLPGVLDRFDIQDLDTIRTVLASVITGVFTLTIFAYTMVMNVIDRSISSYSPRLLPLILAERYHQEILGVGAGTIAHSVILLLGVADPPDAAHPPVLAAATAGFFAVVSLVLFIYFIHRVSRSIHVNVLLRKSFDHTLRRLRQITGDRGKLVRVEDSSAPEHERHYRAGTCGYLDEVDIDGLCILSTRIGAPLHLLARPGAFVFVGDPVVGWSEGTLEDADKLANYFKISPNEPVDTYATGFRHLVEVSIKAASPAINDPATAMTAINYLGQLFRALTDVPAHNAAEDTEGKGRVYLTDWTYADLLHSCFRELRCYLDSDPWGVDVLRKNLLGVEQACERAGRHQDAAAARRELALLLNKPD